MVSLKETFHLRTSYTSFTRTGLRFSLSIMTISLTKKPSCQGSLTVGSPNLLPYMRTLRGADIVVVRQCSKTPASRRIFPVGSSCVFAVVRIGWCQRWCQNRLTFRGFASSRLSREGVQRVLRDPGALRR